MTNPHQQQQDHSRDADDIFEAAAEQIVAESEGK